MHFFFLSRHSYELRCSFVVHLCRQAFIYFVSFCCHTFMYFIFPLVIHLYFVFLSSYIHPFHSSSRQVFIYIFCFFCRHTFIYFIFSHVIHFSSSYIYLLLFFHDLCAKTCLKTYFIKLIQAER